jgi:lysophospholipase L1-like esterase
LKIPQIPVIVHIVSKVGIFLTIFSLISCVSKHTPAQEQPLPPPLHEEHIECGSEAFPMVTPGATVMLIGDSLAVGMEPKFVSLARRGGYVPVTHAVNGTSIFQWMKWIKSDLEKNKPELVVVSLGTNDAIIYDRVKQHSHLYGEFTRIIEESGAVLVWLGPPDITLKRIPHIEDERALIRKSTTHYFPSEAIERPMGGDGIHSSPAGYNRWMGAAWDWMIDQNILTKSDN